MKTADTFIMMNFFRRKNDDFFQTNATGFGSSSRFSGGRFYNKDGSVNVSKRGMPWYQRTSLFHWLLELPGWKFIAGIILFFIAINVLFAFIYLIIGVENLNGMQTSSFSEQLGECFFFSAQTFTTVGYGRVNPTGFLASLTAAIEALLGLLSFALATGLLYGRFSRPKAYILYSHNAIIAPYKQGRAFMFRLAPYKNNHLTESEITLTLAMQLLENGELKNKFYVLPLEINRINALALSWTIVHPIDENSPLFGMEADDLKSAGTEFMIFLKAFDESFSNTVMSRTSYTHQEVVFGAKFRMMYHESDDDTTTLLDLDKINEYERVTLPAYPLQNGNSRENTNVYAQ